MLCELVPLLTTAISESYQSKPVYRKKPLAGIGLFARNWLDVNYIERKRSEFAAIGFGRVQQRRLTTEIRIGARPRSRSIDIRLAL